MDRAAEAWSAKHPPGASRLEHLPAVRAPPPRPVDRFVPLPAVARLDAVPALHHGSALAAHQPNAARLHGQDRTAEPASNRGQCPVRASCITHRRSVGRDREQYSIFVRLPRPMIPPGRPEGIAHPAHGRRSPPQLRGNPREVRQRFALGGKPSFGIGPGLPVHHSSAESNPVRAAARSRSMPPVTSALNDDARPARS